MLRSTVCMANARWFPAAKYSAVQLTPHCIYAEHCMYILFLLSGRGKHAAQPHGLTDWTPLLV